MALGALVRRIAPDVLHVHTVMNPVALESQGPAGSISARDPLMLPMSPQASGSPLTAGGLRAR
jgi:hypothetical protein